MKEDIVVPDGNETEFAEMGKRLRYLTLYFAYSNNIPKIDFESLGNRFGLTIVPALFTSKEKIGKDINKTKYLIISATSDDRAVFENNKVWLVLGVEGSEKKDHMHNRRSGLNQVLCSLAKEHNIRLGASLQDILILSDRRKVQILGRLSANARLCRKYKVNYQIYSFAENPGDMVGRTEKESLLTCL